MFRIPRWVIAFAMPATSGLEYTVTEYERGKFRLEQVTVNRDPLDDSVNYTVLLMGRTPSWRLRSM